ncbi:S41 family peptidase [candidate division KSB1 bacterium]
MFKLKRPYTRFLSIFLIVFLFVIFIYGFEHLLSFPANDEYNLRLLNIIFNEIKEKYVEEIDESSLIKLGIDGMLEGFDPYTDFYDSKRLSQLNSITTGKYGGIGFYISMIDSEFTLISPLEDSPAIDAGIRQGDVIIRVDGIETKGMNIGDVTDVIKGEEGTVVMLAIKRRGLPSPIEIPVTRRSILLKDVAYSKMLDNHIGYIKLNHFSQNASGDIYKAVRELQKSGLNGLILDVRGNQGGLLSSAVKVVDLFVEKEELIVSTKGRNEEFSSNHISRRNAIYSNKPLVVMVDHSSASASEILAGAIQDLDRGVVVGKKTFGKGLVQTVFYPTPNTALKMTTARYYTPSGRCIDGTKISSAKEINNKENIYYTKSGRVVHGGGGITPDIVVSDDGGHVSELLRQSVFLKFAIDYAIKHYGMQKVDVDDEILVQFMEFVSAGGFGSGKKGLEEVEKLIEMGSEENYGREYEKHINRLREIITEKNRLELDLSDPHIAYNLRDRMNWVLMGERGKLEATIDDDIYIKEAINIFNQKERYNQLLKNINVSKHSLK